MAGIAYKATFAPTASRGLESWLARSGATLAVTAYQVGKLFLMGLLGSSPMARFRRSSAVLPAA